MVDVCETCGLEKIGGRCLTRWCDDRHESVDRLEVTEKGDESDR
ncbi:hypothetical protein ACFOZ7_09545 [Natribaculum luteum]|uniref:Uncharacterized protein n=1 Tax=Natribaculum luteum TaxID=1586232 RepID=A0ABD5NZ15_9EURY|nr:hypothetical protein [Natribaculum luteum]